MVTFMTTREMIFDNVTHVKHSSTVRSSAYVEIGRLSSLRQWLSVETTSSRLCLFCSLHVRLLYLSFIWLPTLPYQKTTKSSELCSETGFKNAPKWSCTSSSSSSMVYTGPSQNSPTNRQLFATASSLTHLMPTCLTLSLSTPLPGS